MAANLPIGYYKLEEEYIGAKSREEKIRILEEMLTVIPKHKATQKVIGEIRRKISLLKKEIEVEAKKKKGAGKRGIRKEGAAQVCMLGFPNTGKSYILNSLCNKKIPSTSLPFETTMPEVGMLNHKGVLIQLIEIPSVHPGFYSKRGDLRNLIYTCDALCFVINDEKEIKKIKDEIELGGRLFVVVKSRELDKVSNIIWNVLGLIKVFTKSPGKAPEKTPVALKQGATIENLGNEIHKHFVERLRYAKVIRPKSKIKERQVGLKFKLQDDDIVEFHIR